MKKRYVLSLFICITSLSGVFAQLCSDPANVIYGLTNFGGLHSITVNTGVAGAQMNPAYIGNVPSASNGIGYNQLNGKFYFFKRVPNSTPQEFVSFDPATNAVTILANSPTPSTYSVYVGCVTADGSGYYCWDSNATLYYYNIALNTWTTITSDIRDQSGNDVDAIIRTHGSGDVAADGVGNLLMLPSSNSKVALYQMNAPLPTSPVASLTVTRIMPPTNPPAKFGGIAFNITGQLLLSSTAPSNRLYRLETNLTFTLLSNLSVSMGDLTSCNFPLLILPSSWESFSAVARTDRSVLLSWEITQQSDTKGYSIEHSMEGLNWKPSGFVQNTDQGYGAKKYSFIDPGVLQGKHSYRIRQLYWNGGSSYSSIKTITIEGSATIALWPNPAQNVLRIEINASNRNTNSRAFLCDQSGRTLKQILLQQGVNSIDIKAFSQGTYLVRVELSHGESYHQKIIKL